MQAGDKTSWQFSLAGNSITNMMEYEELRDRLETLRHQLVYIKNSLSHSESRIQDSIEQTQMTQQGASRLAEKFGEIARDLEETEVEITKSVHKQWLKAKHTGEKECLEKEDSTAQNQAQDDGQGIHHDDKVEWITERINLLETNLNQVELKYE